MATYPRDRKSFFAHRVIRLAFKSCLAQEVGTDAMALLSAIAHTEDAKRYRGPVTYYNSQLQSILGMAKWERLAKSRKSLVEAGWLYYEGQGKRKPGLYWSLVPDEFGTLEDTPMDEGLYPLEGYQQGYKDGYKAGLEEGINREKNGGQSGVQSGSNRGDKQGEPSTLIPKPKPKREAASPFSVKELPSDPSWMTGSEFTATWRAWEKYRREIKHPLTATMADGQLRKLGKMTMEDAIEMMEHTIAMGWQGLRAPEGNGKPKLTEEERRKASVPTDEDLENWTP